MAKRFKLRISRVILSFQSCRSKDPSTFPEDPVRSFSRLTPKQPHRSSFKRHVSTALSVGCGRACPQYASGDDYTGSQRFLWETEDEWHVIEKESSPRRKIYNSSVSGDEVLSFPAPVKKKLRSKKKRSSSAVGTPDSVIFTSGDGVGDGSGEETETLFSSSRSFSTDSSTDYNPQLETIREAAPARRKKTKTKKVKKNLKNSPELMAGLETPARLSMLKKVISCEIEGKVKESFAVVKKSADPLGDFKKSMMEMIVEKNMFEESDLEQLLQCFLSLNSRHHHRVIVEAFSEIWNAIFVGGRRALF